MFDGMELDDDRVLMGEGKGLEVVQIRLGLARLTHCMRWVGLAKRAVDAQSRGIDGRLVVLTRTGRYSADLVHSDDCQIE